MSNDHYVAQTYLKHFGDPHQKGILHAYKKYNGDAFSCWPKDVCSEWDGDKNSFLKDMELLGDFRKIFEPHWNSSIASIFLSDISNNDKFIISGYMANLMICTPAWIRVAQKIYATHASDRCSLEKKYGGIDECLKEGIEMLEKGELKLTVNSNFIKALSTKWLLSTAIQTYNQDWEIILNNTSYPFITSDNPVVIDYSGNLGERMVRFLTITPTMCLRVKYNYIGNYTPENIAIYIKLPPYGKIQKSEWNSQGIKHINRLVVKCAENLIFSSKKDSQLQALVLKYNKYRLDADYIEIPGEENSIYQNTTLRVREI